MNFIFVRSRSLWFARRNNDNGGYDTHHSEASTLHAIESELNRVRVAIGGLGRNDAPNRGARNEV
jgi:hypothetical protein